MGYVNKVVLMGNLTKDIELRYTHSGKAVANASMAINNRNEATFVDVVFWERTAEIAAEYLKKGDNFFVEGRLRLNKFQTRDGDNRQKLEVHVSNLQLLGKKNQDTPQKSETHTDTGEIGDDISDDDIPF